jgi:hypothetical protein
LYLAAGLVPFLLLGSRRVPELVAALHRPAVRFGLLAAAGTGLAVGSVVVFEAEDAAATAASTAELELLPGGVPSVPDKGVILTTDLGTRVAAHVPRVPRDGVALRAGEDKMLHTDGHAGHVIRRGPPGDHCNCHGWVFTGGRYLLGGPEVELILRENGYQEVQVPEPGDVVIYRQGEHTLHTAVVRYVAEGQPVLVEGKWGPLGVYLHPADKSCYGTEYTFYRSERPGHLLSGIGDPAPKTEQPPMVAE